MRQNLGWDQSILFTINMLKKNINLAYYFQLILGMCSMWRCVWGGGGEGGEGAGIK